MPKPPRPKIRPVRSEFARRLEQSRLSAGYDTAADFARALRVEVDTYRRWERGETEPSIAHLNAILALTEVTADFLVAGRLPTIPKNH